MINKVSHRKKNWTLKKVALSKMSAMISVQELVKVKLT